MLRGLVRCYQHTKPYYLTTPIFYPNADPHIGHLYSLVLADIFARYHRIAHPARPVRFITGTDEHGLKIQKAARDQGVTETELVDRLGERFKELAERANITYTRFVRTSSPSHKQGVQHLWRQLAQRGYIYKSTHSGFYSITDECFYTPTQITSRTHPTTRVVQKVALETGSAVEWAEEVNWKFRLSEFTDRLIAHLERTPTWIRPSTQHALVLHTLHAARTQPSLLPDLSVSRPRARLTWGVPVPDDPEQTVYVWLDALSAYLTAVGYPASFTSAQEMAESGWPCDLHVIGKDILKFHAIYFPAFLMALDLPLPRGILSHAHWTTNRAKMSKSVGNVVAPLPLLSPSPSPLSSSSSSSRKANTSPPPPSPSSSKSDTTRWYLARVGGRFRDDVDWSGVQRAKHADELRDILGNLVLRVAGAGGKVRARIEADFELELGKTKAEAKEYWASLPLDRGVLLAECEVEGKEWKAELRSLKARYVQHMEKLEVGEAVDAIVRVLTLANAHLTHTQPWSVTTPLPRALDALIWARETLRVAGILLQPVVPALAGRLLDALGVGVGVGGIGGEGGGGGGGGGGVGNIIGEVGEGGRGGEGERALASAEVGRGRVDAGSVKRVVLVPREED